MSQQDQDNAISDLQDRPDRLSVYNGDKEQFPNAENKSLGFHDGIHPVDETAESMAEAAEVAHQDDENEASVTDQILSLPEPIDVSIKKAKKPRRNKKSASKRGLDKPTGFEEYHADAPLTPAEYEVEQELYQREISFIDRILTAIRRFEQHRKFDPQRRDVFYKWLSYGGVEVGPNMFSSVLNKEDLDKDQLSAALTHTSLSDDKYDIGNPKSKYVVDFEGCMKAFLSRRAVFYYGFETQPQVQMVTNVLSRFMDYLLQHDVCPEHNLDILAARTVCKTATNELWACAEAQRWLPGDFNVACSTLFGGSYAQLKYDGVTSWDPDDAEQLSFLGFTQEVAMQIASLAVTTVADEDIYQTYLAMIEKNNFEVVKTIEGEGFEISSIEPVTDATQDFYQKHAANLRPIGRVHAKAWKRPDRPPEDLTDAELLQSSPSHPTSSASSDTERAYIFFVEDAILRNLFVGMKIEATIRRLNCGIDFFDAVMRAYCSFDSWLCNELMIGWKEPKPLKGAVAYESDELGRLEPDVAEEVDKKDESRNGNESVARPGERDENVEAIGDAGVRPESIQGGEPGRKKVATEGGELQ